MDMLNSKARTHDTGVGRTVAWAYSFEDALRLLGREPAASAVVFERTWTAVDRTRQRAEAAGLGRRLSVHHLDASTIADRWRRAG